MINNSSEHLNFPSLLNFFLCILLFFLPFVPSSSLFFFFNTFCILLYFPPFVLPSILLLPSLLGKMEGERTTERERGRERGGKATHSMSPFLFFHMLSISFLLPPFSQHCASFYTTSLPFPSLSFYTDPFLSPSTSSSLIFFPPLFIDSMYAPHPESKENNE